MMAGRLADRVALVTGGSRGIGRAIALAFAREGAAVVVNYATRRDDAGRVVDEIGKSGGHAIAIGADVSREPEVRAMVDEARRRVGPIAVLVNNAGISARATLQSMTDAMLDEVIGVNVKGVVYCTRAAVPGMIERRHGRIVNITSIAGLGTSLPSTTPYAATKAAVIALTKRFALELGPHGITVNAISPGFIATEMTETSSTSYDAAAQKAVLGRVGRPEDIAAAALFLASEESSFITAQALSVDGGRMDFLSRSA
jgi:3-oxoacyl-[acyl-carrier protein] reductase